MKKFQRNYLFFIFLFFVSMFVSAQSHAHELEQDSTGNTLKINVNNDQTFPCYSGNHYSIANWEPF